MATLGQLGVNGLLAVNSWIGMINSNLQGSSRIAYKPTRPSFRDGVVTTLGNNIFIPSPTLSIQATTLEWAQGPIVNSQSQSHFALQGEGFFVVTDAGGKYYLTRDGEFHWDGQGYLVNSNGLRVVSSGQDFIRMHRSDASQIFDPQGESVELWRYGDKSFLIVDVANRDGLRFSPYGATVFELDGDLPLRVRNDFRSSMDGITFGYFDPLQRTYIDAIDVPPLITAPVGPATDFSINLGANGVFNFSRAGGPLGGAFFDPAVHTIQDVVDAINDYGTDLGIDVSAVYDPVSDRLKITNIPEPKVDDPGFIFGNFAIDFGANGLFTMHGFDPKTTSIQNIVDAINRYAVRNGVNVSASFNQATSSFSITNNTPAATNNEISFEGANAQGIANFMQMPLTTPSTGGGANATAPTVEIDRFPTVSANTLADISVNDVRMPIYYLIHPHSEIRLDGGNGRALEQFFRLDRVPFQEAFDPVTGRYGLSIESSRDIDNSSILNSSVAGEQDLDILAADVAVKTFLDYTTTSDTTVPAFDFSGPPPLYSHNKVSGRVISAGAANSHGLLAIGQAQTTDAFDLVLDYQTDSAMLELNFGYDKPEQIDSGGFTLFYNTATGALDLGLRSRDPNEPPVIIDSRPAGTMPVATGFAGLNQRLSTTLSREGLLTFSIDGAAPAVFNLAGFNQQRTGYLSLGHQGNRLELDHLYVDYHGFQNQLATGELVSLSPTPYASPEVREGHQDRPRTRIQQSALEQSTASLTEYVPMLALAQKVFAAISKIISTSSLLEDDINSLIR